MRKQLALEFLLVVIGIIGYVNLEETKEDKVGHKHHEEKRYESPIVRVARK